jgi:metal-responsive CopG/Arc/MetJ family transcriptional regulator
VSILVHRVRTIGIRLSEEEYAELENFCIASGARSISDLARTAILRFVNREHQENALALAVSTHDVQVRELEQRLQQLTAEMALLKARTLLD